MYAKLVFPQGTDNTLICRDITRCIVNSTGAGGSTVGALEAVDAGKSTITDTEAAGWSLAAGQTLPTGVSVVDDKEYFLQQAHNNGTTKTVAVRHHLVSNDANVTKENNTSGYNAVRIIPVLDYGETYESVPLTPTRTSSPSTSLDTWSGVSALFAEATVHVIARDKMIFLAGDRKGYNGDFNYTLIQETPENYYTREGRNRPGQVMFLGCKNTRSSFGNTAPSSETKVINFTSTNIMGTNYKLPFVAHYFDALYDYLENKEIRLAGLYQKGFIATQSAPSNASPTACSQYAIARDIGQADGYSALWNYDAVTNDLQKPTEYFFGTQSSYWAFRYHYGCGVAVAHSYNDRRDAAGLKDLNGNPTALLIPIMYSTGNGGHFIDYTSNSDFYICTVNSVLSPGIINDGTNDYLALPVGDTNGIIGSYAIKV